jgi:hypothetical protein
MGLSEAAIVTAQQLYSAFSDLRVELERTLSEWNVLLQTAWEAVSQLQAVAQVSEQVQAVDLDGNELPFSIPVDYWSQGRLGQLQAELNAVRGSGRSGPAPVTRGSRTLAVYRFADLLPGTRRYRSRCPSECVEFATAHQHR